MFVCVYPAIKQCVCVPPQSADCLLEPCVCILRKLVYADPSLRHSLAQRSLLLLTLVRGTFTTQHIKGPLLYCFSSVYHRSQIYTEPVSDWLEHQTDHCSITHNPLCFSPVSKVLILCLLL